MLHSVNMSLLNEYEFNVAMLRLLCSTQANHEQRRTSGSRSVIEQPRCYRSGVWTSQTSSTRFVSNPRRLYKYMSKHYLTSKNRHESSNNRIVTEQFLTLTENNSNPASKAFIVNHSQFYATTTDTILYPHPETVNRNILNAIRHVPTFCDVI